MATYQLRPINAPEFSVKKQPTQPESGSDQFVAAMLDLSPTAKARKNPWRVAMSIAAHVVLLGAAIIAPIYFADDALNLTAMTKTFLVAPPPPAPPPPPAQMQRVAKITPVHTIAAAPLVAPKVVPKNIEVAKDEPPAEAPDASTGVTGGVPGGELGGVLSGVGSSAPPPPKQPSVLRVGGDVKAPQLITKVDPDYPAVAKVSRVQGSVQIDAVIDQHGNVVRAHAVGGPGLLIPAALAAVDKWKYAPTYLNGQPISVAMQVTVDFRLG